jgi:N-acetylmuramoyl-L-alanine amidase
VTHLELKEMPAWKGIVGKGFTAADFDQYVRSVEMGVWRPSFVVLHNTYIPKLSDWHKVPGAQRMRNLESYYRDTQHWSAGPHLFIADDLIWAFTPLNTPGVHSPSWNAISWGVELVGDYSTEPLSPEVQANATSALASLHVLAGIDPGTLRLHKEDPKTSHKDCPGHNVIKNDVITLVSADMQNSYPGEHTPGAVA